MMLKVGAGFDHKMMSKMHLATNLVARNLRQLCGNLIEKKIDVEKNDVEKTKPFELAGHRFVPSNFFSLPNVSKMYPTISSFFFLVSVLVLPLLPVLPLLFSCPPSPTCPPVFLPSLSYPLLSPSSSSSCPVCCVLCVCVVWWGG